MNLLTTTGIIELLGLLFGLAYIFCAHFKTNFSWLFGILSAACIIYIDVVKTHLYFDAILHIFFMFMSLIGLYLWWQGAETKKVIRISTMPLSSYLTYLFISVLIAGAAGYLFDQQGNAAYPYLDCFQMMLSIFSTFLIIYCVLNAWSYWIIVDLISIGLYFMTGAYLLSLLYLAYLISNAIMWKKWRVEYLKKSSSTRSGIKL